MPVIPNPLNLSNDGDLLQAVGFEIVIERQRVAELSLPSGRLIACDPLASPETEPFAIAVPAGCFPVYAIVAKMREQTKSAYVVIEFSARRPHRWEIAQLSGEESSWKERLGTAVESNIISFMDDRTATVLLNQIHHDDTDELERVIHREMRRNRRSGAQVELADLRVDPTSTANLLAFDADVGTYVTYFGFDGDNNVVMAVLDFEVLDYEFTPFGLKY